jgi:hypothetical protein
MIPTDWARAEAERPDPNTSAFRLAHSALAGCGEFCRTEA